MKKIVKECYCKKEKIKFRCQDRLYHADVVDLLYCPTCVDRASQDTLILEIIKKDKSGLWGIKYNSLILREKDKKNFKDNEKYYIDLFESGKCIFDFISQKTKKGLYRIIGFKNLPELEGSEVLSGPDKTMIKKGGKPTKLPKKTRSGPEESYIPFSG